MQYAPTNTQTVLFPQKNNIVPLQIPFKFTHHANFTFGGHGSPYGLSCGHKRPFALHFAGEHPQDGQNFLIMPVLLAKI
jgi:hypothetical protein